MTKDEQQIATLLAAVDSLITLAASMKHGTLAPNTIRPHAVDVSRIHAWLFVVCAPEVAERYMRCFTEDNGDVRLGLIVAFVTGVRAQFDSEGEAVFGRTPWLFRWAD